MTNARFHQSRLTLISVQLTLHFILVLKIRKRNEIGEKRKKLVEMALE